jgi:hypothetical protein
MAANSSAFSRRTAAVSYGTARATMKVWYSPITNRTVAVDVGTRKRFTANAVLKQAGIAEQV